MMLLDYAIIIILEGKKYVREKDVSIGVIFKKQDNHLGIVF
jgi:hypothetical protein